MGKLYRIIFLIGFLLPIFLQAQTVGMDDEQVIAFATDEFNAGHFYSVPSLLAERLKGFNRNQRQRAYLLLTQTYLLLDDPIGAQRSYLEVLAANPEFVPDEQLHAIDIVYFSKRFTATPKFSWFVGAGSNVSPVRVIIDNSMGKGEKDSYRLLPGYHFGGGGEYSYNDNLKVRAEINLFQTRYRAEGKGLFEGNTRIFTDRQTWVNIPLYICYSDNSGKYRPYGFAGYSVSKLFADKASITTSNPEGINSETGSEMETPGSSFPANSPDLNFLQRRNDINHSIIFGGGVKYKIGLDFVFAEIKYSAGLKNAVNEDFSLSNPTLDRTTPEWVQYLTPGVSFAYQDDYFRLDNLALTIGFLRPLYKPRELRHARTKSVLRKMKRGK